MFEMWNGGIPAKPQSMSCDPSTPSSTSSFSSRHKFLELDVNDVKPSDILKSVLSKKSIFDDDFKRLENIGEKYEPKDYSNLNRSSTIVANTNNSKPTVAAAAAAAVAVAAGATACATQLPKLQSAPPQPAFTAQISQALPRLNAVSPMNSPQPQSPYNSPSPSPIVVTPNMSGAKMTNNIASVQPVKGLQYPFPSHPPIPSSVTNLPSNVQASSAKVVENANSPQDDSNKTKSHSGSKNTNSQDKNSTANNNNNNNNGGSKSSNPNRSLNKSASVPGSNHSGTVRTTLATSVSLNMNIKEESNDSLENVVPSRKTSREEKNLNLKSEHPKKTELLDRRKWDSISSENSDPTSSSEILSERTENERVGRQERHDVVTKLVESTKSKNKTRNQSEIESQEREEPRIKHEFDTKKSDEYEHRRRDLEGDDALHNWKTEYSKPVQNPTKDREHVIAVNHFTTKTDKHNKENAAKSRESTPLDRQSSYVDEMNKNTSKTSRSNSPSKVMPKRRLSSHESVDSDDGKRFKFGGENAKSMERRDFKDPNGRSSSEKQSSKHQRNFNKMNNVHKMEDSSCDVDERPKKESSFDERKKDREADRHRNKNDKSSHRSRRNKEEKKTNQFCKYILNYSIFQI